MSRVLGLRTAVERRDDRSGAGQFSRPFGTEGRARPRIIYPERRSSRHGPGGEAAGRPGSLAPTWRRASLRTMVGVKVQAVPCSVPWSLDSIAAVAHTQALRRRQGSGPTSLEAASGNSAAYRLAGVCGTGSPPPPPPGGVVPQGVCRLHCLVQAAVGISAHADIWLVSYLPGLLSCSLAQCTRYCGTYMDGRATRGPATGTVVSRPEVALGQRLWV